MRCIFVGNRRSDFCTEVHLAKTLEMMGHTITFVQEDKVSAWDIFECAIGMKAPFYKHDLFMWTRTWGISGEADALLRKLEEYGIPTVSYHLDLYLGISRETKMENDLFWKTKYVFTPDGMHAEEFYKRGINHFYIKPGVYAPECYLAAPDNNRSHDIVFVGSGGRKPGEHYHPEWPYRQRLINWLHETYGHRFEHYGLGGIQDTIRGDALNALYASTKVVVGDSLCVGFKSERYWSDRSPETLGRGGFLIHPYIFGMEAEFVNGKHLMYYEFDNFVMLKRMIDFMLVNDCVRETIRVAGHERVKKYCTYTNRMQQMLNILAYHEPSIKIALNR